ncbi:hypothetical protein YC2023_055457 [Brassica napus]
MEEIVNSSGYKSFVQQNPDLGLYITKIFVGALKSQLGSTLDRLVRSALRPKPTSLQLHNILWSNIHQTHRVT